MEEGEVFGLLGPNGAGKSTTIAMLQVVVVMGASALLFGYDLGSEPLALALLVLATGLVVGSVVLAISAVCFGLAVWRFRFDELIQRMAEANAGYTEEEVMAEVQAAIREVREQETVRIPISPVRNTTSKR